MQFLACLPCDSHGRTLLSALTEAKHYLRPRICTGRTGSECSIGSPAFHPADIARALLPPKGLAIPLFYSCGKEEK